ncbi:MAG TPA: radical SAM protein [bacterium]|nr:radical SAM protein [bacterium]
MRVLFLFRNAEWLGIEYLSAMLKQAGHETDLVFDPGAGDIEMRIGLLDPRARFNRLLARRLAEFAPDMVCFSVLTNLFPWVREQAAAVKRLRPGTTVVAGGIHPTMFPEVVLRDPHIDIICRGEEKDAIVELTAALARGEREFAIPNIGYQRGDNSMVINPLRPLRQDLDALPLPDKELFHRWGCFDRRLYVMTGRGCPYNCTYCFNHTYKRLYQGSGAYVRQRSVDNVLHELRIFAARYGTRDIFFYDDTFTQNHGWLREFLPRYRAEIGLPFACNVRANTITAEVAQLLKASGCTYVVMGVESGTERVRNDIMKRNLSDAAMLAAAGHFHAAGLTVCTLNIIGVPGETAEEMWSTVAFNHRLGPLGGSMASTFYPFPETDLFHLAREAGMMDEAVRLQVENGEGSYRSGSLLHHPEKETIARVTAFEPLMVRLPRWTHPLFRRLPPLAVFRLLAVPFFAPWLHFRYRISELLRMQWRFWQLTRAEAADHGGPR